MLVEKIRRERVDGRVARLGEHDRGDQPEFAGLSPEPGDEEGDELGGDHRGPDPDHRLLRDERPLPGIRGEVGVASSSVLVLVMSTGLFILFRKHDWL